MNHLLKKIIAIFSPGKNKRKSEPVEVPPNAIIVQSEGERLFKKSTRPKKKFKLGLGRTPKKWITKIHDGRIMGTLPLAEKVNNFYSALKPIFLVTIRRRQKLWHNVG